MTHGCRRRVGVTHMDGADVAHVHGAGVLRHAWRMRGTRADACQCQHVSNAVIHPHKHERCE